MNIRTTTRAWRVSMLCAGVMAGVALGAPVSAIAQTGDPAQPVEATAPAVRASEVGHSTRVWLDLQSSNTQAAPALPTLGAEAGLAYRRYLESFKSKIPDLYGSTLKGNGGGGPMGGSDAGGSN
jgi:hypothetical protein